MTQLFSGNVYTFGTGSALHVIVSYDKKRQGADMLYQFYYKIFISDRNGNHNSYGWYENPLKATFTLNGTDVWTKTTQGTQGWSFEYTSDWITVKDKVSGTTPFKFTVKDTINTGWCNYTSSTFSLVVDPAGSDLGAVANFNIGNAITVPITKYSSMYDVIVVKIGSTTIKTINNASSPTTITFTSSELNTIYGLTTTVQSTVFTFELTTYEDSSKATIVGTTKSTTARGYIVGSYPLINSITLVDTNSTTTALTGNSSKMIRYKSNVKATVSASGVNKATISSITINGTTASNGIVTFNSASSNSFEVKVVDSRGFTTTQTKTMTMVSYIPLTLNASIKREQPTNGKVVISFSGNYFNGSFGSVSNTLTVQYRAKEKSASWVDEWGTLTPTISGNTYTGSFTGDGYDYQKQYTFQIRVTDKFGTLTPIELELTKGEAILYWNENRVGVNGDFVVKDGKAIKSGKYLNTEDLSAFQTNLFGSNNSGFRFKAIRSAISGDSHYPQYASGMAWSGGDTHGFILTKYGSADVIIGGGNADTVQWRRHMAFTDDLIQKSWSTSSGSIEDFKTFVVNEAPIGNYVYYLNINGSISSAIVLKATAKYASFIWFSYGVKAIQYQYNNGTWTQQNLSYDGIEESGTYWAGRYIKFSDGTMVCMGQFDLGVSTNGWGNIFYAGFADPHTFPVEFKTVNSVVLNVVGAYAGFVTNTQYSTSKITYLGVSTGEDVSNKTFSFDYVAWGTWK